MNIGIDAHMLGHQETGNETYILELVKAVTKLDNQNRFYIAVEDPKYVPEEISERENVELIHLPSASPVRRLLRDLPVAARNLKLDLLHVSYNAPFFCPCPLVVTVHDISYERFPEWFSVRDKLVLSNLVPNSVKRAAQVLTGSDFTARELQALYDTSPDKIEVTPYAFNGKFQMVGDPAALATVTQKYGIDSGFLLAVGNLQPRKNLLTLVRAFSEVKKLSGICRKLVLVGKSQYKASEVYAEVVRLGLESEVIFTGYVPDEDLVLLYNAAEVFIYPSLYEGFGLPVLEAMACGTPVIISCTSCLPEVAGDAALLINPYEVEQMAQSIQKILHSEELRRRLRSEGLKWVKQFSWEHTAQLTLESYYKVGKG